MTSKRMTRAEMIRWLGDAISTETDKPFEEIDYGFVEEGGGRLDELMGKSAAMSEEEIVERIEKLKPDTTSAVRKKIGNRNLWKIVIAAAVVLCMSVTVLAVPAWRQAILTVLQFDVGESVMEDGITYINTGELKVYSDMDELIDTEKLGILSYKDSNNNLVITTIHHISDTLKTIITFNDPTINFYIEHSINVISDTIINNSEEFITPYFIAFIIDKSTASSVKYNAYFVHNNNLYNINCTNKTNLLSLLNSLYSGD